MSEWLCSKLRFGRCFTASVLVIIATVAIVSPLRAEPSDPLGRFLPADPVSREELHQAIHRAADYLVRACGPQGRFAYMVNLDPQAPAVSNYNIVRHAAAIYALAKYCEWTNDPARRLAALAAAQRAADFLQEQAIAPVPGESEMLAVWSDPRITKYKRPRTAKLGGSGLGLAALVQLERVRPGTTPQETLRRLARFLLFLQREDGSFTHRFVPEKGGRDEQYQCLFYPGEAALGLIMLYDRDSQPEYLKASAKAIARLAEDRASASDVPADAWALLTTEQLLPHEEKIRDIVSRRDLERHTAQVCRRMLADRPVFYAEPNLRGCLMTKGHTCGTAARSEGLAAAIACLGSDEQTLRQQVENAVTGAVGFLIRSQVRTGRYMGGIPGSIEALKRNDPQVNLRPSATAIRIDYVQHALALMMQYDAILTKQTPAQTKP